jgi:hypothetical protein
MTELQKRMGALLNSGTLSPNPWDLALCGQKCLALHWRHSNGRQGSAGMRPERRFERRKWHGAASMLRPSLKIRPVEILAYCGPKMVLTRGSTLPAFSSDEAITLDYCRDLSYLISRFDALRSSDNFFFALRVDGTFEYIHARAMRRTKEGVPLVQAA